MFTPFELFVGLRYTRAKRRNHFISFISGISILGIALGIIALVVVLSVMNGFHKEVRERILGMASHAMITSARGGLEEWPEAISLAGNHPEVVGSAPYVETQAMLVSGGSVQGAIVRGVNPDLEPRVSNVGEHMVSGALPDLEAGNYRIVLGRELANLLGATVGDKVTVVVPKASITPVGTMPRLKRFTVSGVFEVGMGDYDRGVALVHIEDAAKLNSLGDAVTGVRLRLVDLIEAPRVSRELAAALPGVYYVSDWTDQHRNFFRALRTEKRMMGIILFLIVLVAAFNIVSTMVMVVTEKQSDIAILRTLGASSTSIMWIFVVQGATIGTLGLVIGVAAGVVLSLNVEPIVAAIERAFSVQFIDPNLYYISQLPSDLQWRDVAMVASGAVLATLLATFYPAWRASRIHPAEALRYE
jgi:lipoprotein-releasing system permease protein